MSFAKKLNVYLGVEESVFEKYSVFNPFVGVDTHLFLDPALLKEVKIEEFRLSYERLVKHFSEVLKLLSISKEKNDIAWRTAVRRLTFKEIKGISIGYGANTGDGNAVGPELASKIATTVTEIIKLGVTDTSIFELVCVFENGLGADRLSDMTISIIYEDIYAYTDRIVRTLELKDDQLHKVKVVATGKEYKLIKNPEDPKKPLLLLPKDLLKDLPMALTRDDIGYIMYFNEQLRNRVSSLIIQDAAKKLSELTKEDYRNIFLNKDDLPQLVESYKTSKAKKYDHKSDPSGEVRWYDDGRIFVEQHPLIIKNKSPKTLNEVNEIVKKIIFQFKRSIESNELYELLYKEPTSELNPRNERYAQRLFFSIADTYCEANNIVLSREPNAGNGPVDFKVASDYKTQVLVEIKLSSGKVRSGFEKQLPTYEINENAQKSFLLVIKVTETSKQIEDIMKIADQASKDGKRIPEVVIVDATPRESASKPLRINK